MTKFNLKLDEDRDYSFYVITFYTCSKYSDSIL